jgi:hypothetical protein
MTAQNEQKYQMALEGVIKLVVERVAANRGWTFNHALEELSQLDIFDRLSDERTKLWTESPVNLADMMEIELRGETVGPEWFFP